MTISPAETLDTDDPGDDVNLRYRYQHCFAAINALSLILPNTTVKRIICENHEDIIVEYTDGTFKALQIKSRDLTQDTFKATDHQVMRAFARFCLLNNEFPNVFTSFEFITNHAFWETSENDKNLVYVIKALKDRGSIKGLRGTNPIRKFVNTIAELSGLDEKVVEATLLLCSVTSRNDTVVAVEKDVPEALFECPGMELKTLSLLKLISAKLIALAGKASTKQTKGSVLALYEIGSDFETVLKSQYLANKYITKEDVEAIIEDCCSQEASFERLCSDDIISPDDFPKGLEIMFEKLERGELQAARVFELEDLVRSMETTYLRWGQKFGLDEANSRLQDLFSVVKFDCTEARVLAEKNGEPFGAVMFDELKQLLKSRATNEPEKVYNCRPEHLLGAAGLLTQDCKAWWSEEFVLSGDRQ